MAMTVPEINASIDHYNAFGSLPLEVMTELFASALTVAAAMALPADAVEPTKPAKKVVFKSQEEAKPEVQA